MEREKAVGDIKTESVGDNLIIMSPSVIVVNQPQAFHG